MPPQKGNSPSQTTRLCKQWCLIHPHLGVKLSSLFSIFLLSLLTLKLFLLPLSINTFCHQLNHTYKYQNKKSYQTVNLEYYIRLPPIFK